MGKKGTEPVTESPTSGKAEQPFFRKADGRRKRNLHIIDESQEITGKTYITKDKKVPDSVTISVKTKAEKERGNEQRRKNDGDHRMAAS